MKLPAFNQMNGAVRQIVARPWLAAGVGVSALLAPAFAQNDDRGYFKTALITTPVVAGGAISGFQVYNAFRENQGRVFNFSRRGSGIFAPTPLHPSPADLSRVSTISELENVASQFYQRRASQPFDFARHQTQASKMFDAVSKQTGKDELLSNAFQNARLAALTPAEAADEAIHDILPSLSSDQMARIIEGKEKGWERFRSDEKFLNTLNANLAKAGKVKDAGGSILSEAKLSANLRMRGLSDDGGKAWDALVAARPEVAKALKGNLKQFKEVQLVSEDVLSGEVGRVLSVSFKKDVGNKTHEFEIPIIDPKTGKVYMGSKYAQEGVGRNIYNSRGVYAGDVFLAENIDQDWKQLRLDKQRAFYFGDVDPLDEFQVIREYEGNTGMNDLAILMKSKTAIPTSLEQFETKGGDTRFTSFNKLDPAARVSLVEDLWNKGLNKVSAEGSFPKGVMDLKGLELLHVGGVIDPSKQMPEFRSHSKAFRLTSVNETSHVKDSLNPFVHTTAYEQLFGDKFVSEAGVRVGAVSGGFKNVLGDLPELVSDLDKPEVQQQFVRGLMEHNTLSEIESRRVWESMQRTLRNEKNLKAARALGRLGEGGFLAREGMHGLNLEGSSTYYVNHLRMNKDDLLRFSSESFGSNQLIGFTRDGKAITAGGEKNFIESTKHLGDGRIAVKVREQFGFKTGIKVDVNGIKGLAYTVDNETFNAARDVYNEMSESVNGWGKKQFLLSSDVDMLAVGHYMHDKSDPVSGVLGAASDTMRRIDKIREGVGDPSRFTQLQNEYLHEMSGAGFMWEHGTLLEQADYVRKLSASQRRDRLKYLANLTDGFMENVGEHIRSNGGYGDSVFSSYRRASNIAESNALGNSLARGSNRIGFLDYVTQTGLPATMRAWSTTQVDLPRETKLTFDMASHLYMRGHHSVLKEIMSRVEYPQGDPAQARQVLEHILGNNFSKPLGASVALGDAFPNGTHSLGSAGARAGSIFDPSVDAFKQNYSLDLGEGANRRYIPVLGHDAFKGRVNQYEFDKYSQTELESGLRMIHETSGDARDSAVDNYFLKMKQAMYGKDGLLRADAVDPLAQAGFIQTRASSLRMNDGSVNPFEVGIGKDAVMKIKDKEIREALLRGESRNAAITRHPVSAMPFVNVKMDEGLTGTNIFGIDEGSRHILHADDDKDTGWLYFLKHGSDGEGRAIEQITNENSLQHQELRLDRALFGIEDDSRRLRKPGIKSFMTRLWDEKNPLKSLLGKSENELAILKARTTGAAVGGFSNTLTRMMMQLEQNPAFARDIHDRSTFSTALWMLRQAPISAQKDGTGKFDLQWARNMTSQLTSNLKDKDHEKLFGTMRGLFEHFQDETEWIPEMNLVGVGQDMANSEGKIKPLVAWWNEHGHDISEKFVGGMNADVDKVYQLVTGSDHMLENPKFIPTLDEAFKALGNHVPYMQGASRGGSRAANMAAQQAGSWNERVKNAAGSVRETLSEVGRSFKNMDLGGAAQALGLGLGVAAIAGVMTSKASFGKRQSANKLRPEVAAGTQDHIPGEPVTGSRSPSRPPRVSYEAPAPRSTYVTPIKSQANIDVQIRGDNQQDSVERAKMLAKMAGNGHSNVTVVNRDKTNLRSLRFRQKMRDTRDEN